MAKRKVDRPERLTEQDVISCIEWLLDQPDDTAYTCFFIGLGWIEGAHYCRNPRYLKLTGAPGLLQHNRLNCYKLFLYVNPYALDD